MTNSRPTVAIAAFVMSLALVAGVAQPASAAPPVSSINMDCTKLASATNPVAAFATPVTQRYAAISELALSPILPSAEVIKTAGGLVCEWSNGIPLDGGWTTGAVGAQVEYLPYAEAGYWAWAAVSGTTTPESFFCSGIYCQLETSGGVDFLLVSLQNPRSAAVGESLARRISTALQLGATTPFVRPVYSAAIDPTCGQIVRPTVWRTAVDSASVLRTFAVPPGASVVHSAMAAAQQPACVYTDKTGSFGAGMLSTIPGGHWSFTTLRPYLTAPGPLTAISVSEMRPGDTAFTRCNAAHTHCILDALIAGHWVQVNLLPVTGYGGGELIRADRLTAMTPLLKEIAVQIYTP